MKIQNMHFQNYGSLLDVQADVGDFTIFVGRNGSGKSLILEALFKFFNEFNTIGGGLPPGFSDYLWYNRDTTNPITFTIRFTLSDDEVAEIFVLPPEALEFLKTKSREAYNQLEIRRSIDIRTGWKTENIVWANLLIVKDDRPMGPDELNKALLPEVPMTKLRFYFFTPGFTPQNIGGDRILVDLEKKICYMSSSVIDSLVVSGIIQSTTETAGQNWREWAKQNQYTVMERPPEPKEIPGLVPPVGSDVIQRVITNLTTKLRAKFKLIPAARDTKATLGYRTPFLDPTILESLRTLSISTQRSEEIRWEEFRTLVEDFFQKRLEPNPAQLLLKDGDLRLPTALVGGGEQAVLGLIWQLVDKDVFFGVEEPENHLHPELTRALSRFLKDIAKTRQTFIATHSPLLVDKIDVTNNWVVRREGKITSIQKIENRDDLKLVLHELGVLPSDIYLKDFVLFVEGGTEREAIIPVFSKKLGLSIEENVAIICVGGEPQIKNYLRIWLDVVRYAPVDYLILLDRHSKGLAFEMAKDMNLNLEKFVILEKGSIEDYYPMNELVNALNELFSLKISVEDIDKGKPRAQEIKRILESHQKLRGRWKVDIGEYVAERISQDQIPEEIRKVIAYIKEKIRAG